MQYCDIAILIMGERKQNVNSLMKCMRKSYPSLYRCFFLPCLAFLRNPTLAQLVDSSLQWPNFSFSVKSKSVLVCSFVNHRFEVGLQRKARKGRNNDKDTGMICAYTLSKNKHLFPFTHVLIYLGQKEVP